MSRQSTPAKGTCTPPKRLVGPRPLHLGTGSLSLSSTSGIASPPTTAPLPHRMGSVSYSLRDDFRHGDEQGEKPRLARGGSLRDANPGGRRGRHGPSLSIATSIVGVGVEGALERAQREILERKRRSAPALDDQPPPVLTLTEKHKDLLHFIAQKEAKCVELRAQLATHEADLLQLKKKWEKIVAKGNDRQARSSSGAVELVRGIFGLGEPAIPFSSHAPSPQSYSSSSASTPGYVSSPVLATSPYRTAKPPLTTASRAASRGHFSHTPHSSSSSSSTALSSGNTTRLSLSSASSLGGAELLKEKDEPEPAREVDDDDPDAWGPFETAQTEEPESIVGSALGLSGVESKDKPQYDATPTQNPLWVSNAVGKKLEGLRGTEAFAKSTKRASTLLSDVSSALTTTLNTLAPPPAPSLTKPSGLGTVASRPGPAIRLTSPQPKILSPSPVAKSSKPTPAPIFTRPVSLLDDDEGAGDGLGAVLQPSPSASAKTKVSDTGSARTTSDTFGDDWNW